MPLMRPVTPQNKSHKTSCVVDNRPATSQDKGKFCDLNNIVLAKNLLIKHSACIHATHFHISYYSFFVVELEIGLF